MSKEFQDFKDFCDFVKDKFLLQKRPFIIAVGPSPNTDSGRAILVYGTPQQVSSLLVETLITTGEKPEKMEDDSDG